jgi:hypothetical protein
LVSILFCALFLAIVLTIKFIKNKVA